MVTFPSTTFASEYELTLTIAAASAYGLFYTYPTNATTAASTTMTPLVYCTSTTQDWSASTVTYTLWPQATTIATLFDSLRPVSMGIQAFSVGSSTNDGGELCVGLAPRETTSVKYNCGTYATLSGASFTKTFPFKTGGYATWKPMDNYDLEYQNSFLNSTPGTAGAPDAYPPALVVGWSSLAAGAVIKIRVICNWEAIAATDLTNFVGGAYSPHEQSSLDRAMKWAAGAFNNMGSVFSTISPYVSPIAMGVARRTIENYGYRGLGITG